jgi:hypothetical protein
MKPLRRHHAGWKWSADRIRGYRNEAACQQDVGLHAVTERLIGERHALHRDRASSRVVCGRQTNGVMTGSLPGHDRLFQACQRFCNCHRRLMRAIGSRVATITFPLLPAGTKHIDAANNAANNRSADAD